ncbi:uncharacterized protein LOC108094714 [Drosophila ficusphila]|uniref:uncharacterized protein LOC108094714 n=1 Tax=Drosophila ficusphila TaxID=30025 RepID=UPI0007E89976|nr:uncharacterized protein LOC108094714 [Drosophila ficusphila]
MEIHSEVGNPTSSSSEETSSCGTDSEDEANSTSDPEANEKVGIADRQRSRYTPLSGDSDNDWDEGGIFCEEAISLLAHEILCCETDSESESDDNGAKDNGKIDGILEYGLQNPYKLMLSEEDEDPNENFEEKETNLLLNKQSEEK